MTESYGSPTPPPVGTTPPTSTSDVAKDQTRAVGEDAKEGGRHVADVAKQETQNVAGEAKNQAQDLWHQTRSELMDQSGQQQQRVAKGLRSLGDELSTMSQGSQQQGLASDLTARAAEQARKAAEYLDGRDPGSLLNEVKGFARRRPGTFLAVAAGLGVLGGRLSRSMMPEHEDESRMRSYPAAGYGTGTASSGTAAPGTGGYRTAAGTTGYAGAAGTGDYMSDASAGPRTGTGTGGAVDPLASVDPRTGRERTNAGRDTDALGGEVDR